MVIEIKQPESITRARWVSLLEELGLDPSDVRHFEGSYDHLRVEVFARNKKGVPYLVYDDNGASEVATHVVTIKIEDPPDQV